MLKSLIDHKYDNPIEPSASAIARCCMGGDGRGGGWGGWGCHVYASVSCVTFDPEKNKMLNERSLRGCHVSFTVLPSTLKTTHTWLGDFSSHGNSTTKKGVVRETEECEKGEGVVEQMSQDRSFYAQHMFVSFNTKLTRSLNRVN